MLPVFRGRTLRFRALTESALLPDEIVLSAKSPTENRAQLPIWSDLARADPNRVVWIHPSPTSRSYIDIETAGQQHTGTSLTDDAALDKWLSRDRVIIDISGLPHHIWAPLLRRLHSMRVQTRVVYVEPASYQAHSSPASDSLFDLTSTFLGLAPLPGFARLAGPANEDKCLFVATLGFEGSRPESIFSQLDPAPKVIPLIGVPGFQIEYPAFTVACNRSFLEAGRAHHEIRLARASCPFEAFDALRKIHTDYPDHYMYLAPVGTKPHALGAILYALEHPTQTEVVFDNPVRKAGRTAGVGVIHIYDLCRYDNF